MDTLVSREWVRERLGEPGVVILDATLPPVGVTPPVDTRARYRECHIPGAVFFDIDELSDHTTRLPHMLPSPESFAQSMEKLGVGHTMTIIVYEQGELFSAPRAWWMLRTFGAQHVYVLDGGLRAWISAGFPTDGDDVHRPAAVFQAQFDANAVRSLGDVQRTIRDGGQILDARSAARFSGVASEPRPGIRSGHMPGAINVPYAELLHNGGLKSADELRNEFKARGVDLGKVVITSCGSGVTAAVLLLALEAAGSKDVSLYDGSWAEYAQDPAALIETGD